MKLCAWIPAAEEDAFLGHLREALDSSVTLWTAEEAPPDEAARVLVQGVPTEAQLDACPTLERLVIPYAGLPPATRSCMLARPGVAVHNLHHNAASTAELAMALLLAAAKDIVPHDRDLRAGDWSRRWAPPRTATLAGGHALVLGYGAVGQRVAHALTGLGMRVSAVRRGASEGDRHGMIALAPPAGLPRLLRSADAVLVCLPLTHETEGFLDAVSLRLLRPTAYLVNVGRGSLVDEEALYEALREGRLAGAGLDVWYRYPREASRRTDTLPSAFPFHELENVVLSPHRAGLTRQNEQARAKALAALLHAAARGDEVPNQVDLERGY